jgi:hypothetical protein
MSEIPELKKAMSEYSDAVADYWASQYDDRSHTKFLIAQQRMDAAHAKLTEIEDALQQRIATLEAQLRWIPVSEKPKGGEAYFIAFLNGEAYDWSYYCDGKWTKLNDDDQRLVTHYKDFNRLPNPPEEKA